MTATTAEIPTPAAHALSPLRMVPAPERHANAARSAALRVLSALEAIATDPASSEKAQREARRDILAHAAAIERAAMSAARPVLPMRQPAKVAPAPADPEPLDLPGR